jgi:hypothetical protein
MSDMILANGRPILRGSGSRRIAESYLSEARPGSVAFQAQPRQYPEAAGDRQRCHVGGKSSSLEIGIEACVALGLFRGTGLDLNFFIAHRL